MSTLGQAGKVGAMVLVSLVLIAAGFTFFSGGAFRHTYTVDVLFDDASGATKDAAVTLAGVQIGSVQKVTLTAARKADLTLEIQDTLAGKPVSLPRGSTFSIVTPILGSTGQVIVLPPAGAPPSGPDIQAGATDLVGQSSPNLNTAFNKANVLLAQLSETTRRSDRLIDALTKTADSAQDAIGGPEVKSSLRNLNQASANGLKLTKDLDRTLAQDNAQLQGLLRQTGAGANTALGNIDATTAQFKTLAVQNRAKLNQIVSDLQTTTSALSGITSQANEDFRGGHLTRNMAAIVADAKTASDNLVVISGNFQKLSGDQGLQGDLRATLQNIRESSAQTSYLLERLNQLAGTRRRPALVVGPGGAVIVAPDTPPPGGTPPTHTDQGLVAPSLLPRYDLVQDLRARHFRTDLDAVIPVQGRAPGLFGRIGVYGFGDTNRGILEAGQALGPGGLFDVRGGLYASKLSLGGDIGLGRRATLSLDAWDPNNYHLDARGELMLTDRFGLIVGAEDLTKHAGPTVGLEFRR